MGKKTICDVEECKFQVAVIIGNCKWCSKRFCGTHRLPEGHMCEGLQKCRETHFDRNKDKLMAEKTVSVKVWMKFISTIEYAGGGLAGVLGTNSIIERHLDNNRIRQGLGSVVGVGHIFVPLCDSCWGRRRTVVLNHDPHKTTLMPTVRARFAHLNNLVTAIAFLVCWFHFSKICVFCCGGRWLWRGLYPK